MAAPKLKSNLYGPHVTEGLTDRQYKYQFDVIKGRLAETLIQQLFLSSGYNVFRYGMESTIPAIMGLLKDVHTEVAQEIRRMPDFVIQHPQTKDVHFIEVKFRAGGCFSFEGLKGEYPYMNAFIIVVSRKHIKCLSAKELKDGKLITADCTNYLGNRKEFELDKQVIIDFCNFAVLFFENV